MHQDAVEMKIRKSDERGHSRYSWLDARFTFSFADYYDPEYLGFRTMRVMNNDTIQPSGGFDTHSHKDMEIITYVVEGAVAHKDSMGYETVIEAGDVQKITAGTGIRHSEFNPSKARTTKLYQIWIIPNQNGLKPEYQEVRVSDLERVKGLKLLASSNRADNVLYINQDVKIFEGMLESEQKLVYETDKERGVWIQVVSGSLKIEDMQLVEGDGMSIENTESIVLQAKNTSIFILFDLN